MRECMYKPLFARVLIEREIDKGKNGIIVPDAIAKRHARCEGKIIAMGPTADKTIQVGMRAIFGRHSGVWLDNTYSLAKNPQGQIGTKDNDDGTLFLCQDEDLLAIIEQGE